MIDIAKRWENYRKANSSRPSARENELRKAFELVNPHLGQKILEVGTGNGFLTFPLADAVGKSGEIVTTDVTQENLDDVEHSNQARQLNIKTQLFTEEDNQPFSKEYKDYFDTVATIATLHHFDNRTKATGETGRHQAIAEFYTVLKSGGKLVLADPAFDTITQKYFYSIDSPQYCYPNGHPHDFFTTDRLHEVVREVGFKDIAIELLYVPWRFESGEAAKDFVHTIHNAQCSVEESFAVAKEVLGFKKIDNHYELGWELFFLTAHK
jgi:ubiquinone/menaquinone biosynthesis C-methylase UbiE